MGTGRLAELSRQEPRGLSCGQQQPWHTWWSHCERDPQGERGCYGPISQLLFNRSRAAREEEGEIGDPHPMALLRRLGPFDTGRRPHIRGNLCGRSVKRRGPPGMAVCSTPDSQEAGRARLHDENQHWCCRAKQRAGGQSRTPALESVVCTDTPPTCVLEQELKEVWHRPPPPGGAPETLRSTTTPHRGCGLPEGVCGIQKEPLTTPSGVRKCQVI